MRKTTVFTFVVLTVLSVGGYLFIEQPFAGDRGRVVALSERFMEDLQFKDFRSSSLYHHELERGRVDVGRTIERLFLIKPEMLDIREWRVVKGEIDSTGERARVHFSVKFQRLNLEKEPEEGEVILYWIKRHPDCPLGASCGEDAVCVDEFGEVLKRPKEDEREGREKQVGDAAEAEPTEEPFACDPKAEARWFMNLDSTLKEKRYNY